MSVSLRQDGHATGRQAPTALYLDLLKRSLTGAVHQDTYALERRGDRVVGQEAMRVLRRNDIELVRRRSGEERRAQIHEGRGGWPLVGETMIGLERLDNLHRCMEGVLRDGVPGDFIEAGVWRGGAAIFIRGFLKAHGVTDRCVWAADSFEGLPPPDPNRYPADAGDTHHTHPQLAVSEEVVRQNFRRYGLLDDQVRLLKGWFRDSLPTLADKTWAIVRIDGDMYESTMDALTNLYPNLSVGGFLIVDDYGAIPACRQAVDDYREAHAVVEPLEPIDWTGVYWRRGPGRKTSWRNTAAQ